MSDSYGDPYGDPDGDPRRSASQNPADDPFGHTPDDQPSGAPPYRPPAYDGAEYSQPGSRQGGNTPGAPGAPPSAQAAYSRPTGAPANPANPAAGAAAPAATKTRSAAARRPRTTRGRFWLGFVLSFALLSLATCGGVAVALGLDELRISDFAGSGTAWTPPTLMPTPEAPAQASADAAAGTEDVPVAVGRFAPGQTVRNITNSRVNVRRTPGHLGKGGDDVIVQVTAGDPVVIQGESTGADNLTWWLVSYQGVEGWMAESTASGVQILGE